jgi:hypothetical protein
MWCLDGGDQVVIERDGFPVSEPIANDGTEDDFAGGRGRGSYTYRVCLKNGGECTPRVGVEF